MIMPTIKQLLRALKFTVLTFATTHLILSYALMIFRDYNEGNLFRILNYQKVIPDIDSGMKYFIISNVIAVGVYFIYLGVVLYRDKRARADNK